MWKKRKNETLGLFVPKNAIQEGNVTTEGRIRIDGHFSGKVFSESQLAIGKDGLFEGDADVFSAEIAGFFRGTLRVQNKLIILKTGSFSGKLDAPIAKIEEGSQIEGEIRIKK